MSRFQSAMVPCYLGIRDIVKEHVVAVIIHTWRYKILLGKRAQGDEMSGCEANWRAKKIDDVKFVE